jgi:phosphopantothenoylcysteine decarboxylase/phosphopantothenate--cysteine ligase
MIVANQVGIEGIGFESEENAAHVLWDDQEIVLPQCTKLHLAEQLIDIISQRYQDTKDS